MGNLFHRLGAALALLAIVIAVAWNAWTFDLRQQAREQFDAQFAGRGTSVPQISSITPTGLAEGYARVRASTRRLERSMTFGGMLILGGLFAYGLGVAARQANRGGGKR